MIPKIVKETSKEIKKKKVKMMGMAMKEEEEEIMIKKNLNRMKMIHIISWIKQIRLRIMIRTAAKINKIPVGKTKEARVRTRKGSRASTLTAHKALQQIAIMQVMPLT